ncbi:restriction endonuclease [Alkaliphilus hydrothermalis]|uniref:Restriction endonuclease type IV Mrr domain-containing protein n=1 Tax=Alkaliphilus hydrothermalis TaxID=1482730 RepID=A0ABS2NNU9_9FIRM|nr:restriction endonuclease [Alkaliphilus hydrothermalis]MBM7614606.1 hypothetical protein [Alkaliphilus hydrothermalis]
MSKTKDVLEFLLKQVRSYNQDRSTSRRFRNYYLSSKEDTRGDIAKVIDYAISRIMVFFMVFIGIFIKSKKLSLAIVIAAVVVTIYHILSIKARYKKLEAMKRQKRRTIACQKIYQELMNYTVDELKRYVINIFTKAGFTSFNHRVSSHKVITYDGIYNGQNILMSTYINKTDYFVELKELKEFISLMKGSDIKNGIIMTSSDFTNDCYQYVENLEKKAKLKILLLNKDLMFHMIEKNDLFPSDEEIDEIVENKISRKELIWKKYKASFLANRKSKGYFILTLFLFVTGPYTPYPLYYMTVGGITLALTIITLAMRMMYKKDDQDTWEHLNDMMKEL